MTIFPFTDDLGSMLQIYLSAVFGDIVKLVRSYVDLGLIKARLLGFSKATGDVIVFMDSHMEVQQKWYSYLYNVGLF